MNVGVLAARTSPQSLKLNFCRQLETGERGKGLEIRKLPATAQIEGLKPSRRLILGGNLRIGNVPRDRDKLPLAIACLTRALASSSATSKIVLGWKKGDIHDKKSQ